MTTVFAGGNYSENICWTYFFTDMRGGYWLLRIFGISMGILNNVSYVLIKVMANKVGFKNNVVRDRFIFVFTFVISFMNSGLFATEN